MAIDEINITEDSVKEFFDSIDTEALAESLRKIEDSTRVAIHNECAYCTPDHTTTKPLDSWKIEDQSGCAGINRLDNTLWYHVTDGQNLVASRFKINFCPKCGRELEDTNE